MGLGQCGCKNCNLKDIFNFLCLKIMVAKLTWFNTNHCVYVWEMETHTERGGYVCVHVYIARGRCACVHMYIARGRFACVRVYIVHMRVYGAQRLMARASLNHSSPYVLRWGLSLHLRLMDSESLTGQWVPGIDSSWSLRARIVDVCYCAQVLTWIWGTELRFLSSTWPIELFL